MRFRIASWLQVQPDKNQVNTTGEEAENVITSLNMTDEGANDYNITIIKLEEHFIMRRNVIFKHAKFNQRQAIGE